jgi:hypothetical protein
MVSRGAIGTSSCEVKQLEGRQVLLGGLPPPLFTGVRGRVMLRTSPLQSSRKFAQGFGGWHHALVVKGKTR